MSFYDTIKEFKDFDYDAFFRRVSDDQVKSAIAKDRLNIKDFLTLLSPRAADFIEPMAQKARKLTKQYFGNVIGLYIPIYLSNYCTNECIYCGFNCKNKINRRKLSLEEIEIEAKAIKKTGMQHILFLTGEAPGYTTPEYMGEAAKILEKYFASVSMEVYPMDVDDYKFLRSKGVDGLTVYQETYNEDTYKKVHLSGRKANYLYRLDSPERGCMAGFRYVNIGPLYGLAEKRSEAFLAGLHADYLDRKYPDVELNISLPRINEAEGGYKPASIMTDEDYVQFITAYRLFMPRVGINLSTRETPEFRDHLLDICVTRFSAGSRTDVGGYAEEGSTAQFEISDARTVPEIVHMLEKKGLQPVFKDWEQPF